MTTALAFDAINGKVLYVRSSAGTSHKSFAFFSSWRPGVKSGHSGEKQQLTIAVISG